jgi:hypothetical protein
VVCLLRLTSLNQSLFAGWAKGAAVLVAGRIASSVHTVVDTSMANMVTKMAAEIRSSRLGETEVKRTIDFEKVPRVPPPLAYLSQPHPY